VAEKRLAVVIESMRQAQNNTDRAQTQMFEISSQAEERVSALSAENAILAEGSERMHGKIAELEGELRNLSQNAVIGTAGSGILSSNKQNVGGEDNETLQLVISELRQEIRSKEDALRSEKQRLDGKQRETAQLLVREKEVNS
jgi:hypothetical protein